MVHIVDASISFGLSLEKLLMMITFTLIYVQCYHLNSTEYIRSDAIKHKLYYPNLLLPILRYLHDQIETKLNWNYRSEIIQVHTAIFMVIYPGIHFLTFDLAKTTCTRNTKQTKYCKISEKYKCQALLINLANIDNIKCI